MSVDVDIPHLGDCRSRHYSHGPDGSNELLVIVEDGQPIHFEIALWFNHFHGVRRVLPDSASIYVSRGHAEVHISYRDIPDEYRRVSGAPVAETHSAAKRLVDNDANQLDQTRHSVFRRDAPSIYETHSAILRPVLSSRTVSSGLESGDPDGDRGVRIRDGELESVPSIALARTTDQVDIFDEVTASFIGLYVEGRPGSIG